MADDGHDQVAAEPLAGGRDDRAMKLFELATAAAALLAAVLLASPR
jgi:hypothetical protein